MPEIPYIPQEVALRKKDKTGKDVPNLFMDDEGTPFLMTKEERDKIIALLKDKPDGRYSKHPKKYKAKSADKGGEEVIGIETSYSVIVYDGRYYAVYEGMEKSGHAGAGTFGVVKHAQDLETGEWVVVKNISEKHKVDKAEAARTRKLDEIKNESEGELAKLTKAGKALLDKNKHPQTKKLPQRTTGKKGEQFAVMMQAARGVDLLKYRERLQEKKRPLHPVYCLDLIRKMCIAIDDVHNKDKLIHRDIKLENLRYDPAKKTVTAIDFGLAIDITDAPNHHDISGTPMTIAPETYAGKGYSTKSDAFSLGATIADTYDFLLLDNDNPYKASTLDSIDNPRFVKIVPDLETRKQIYKLCEDLMKTNPDDRITLKEAIQRLEEIENRISHPIKVALVDVQDYKKLDKAGKNAMLANIANNYDEVLLIDTSKDDSRINRLELMRDLQSHGVEVSDNVYPGATADEINSKIQDEYKDKYPTRTYHFHLVDINDALSDEYKISDETVNEILDRDEEAETLIQDANAKVAAYENIFERLEEIIPSIDKQHLIEVFAANKFDDPLSADNNTNISQLLLMKEKALYQLGALAQQQGDDAKAKDYFNRCLKFLETLPLDQMDPAIAGLMETHVEIIKNNINQIDIKNQSRLKDNFNIDIEAMRKRLFDAFPPQERKFGDYVTLLQKILQIQQKLKTTQILSAPDSKYFQDQLEELDRRLSAIEQRKLNEHPAEAVTIDIDKVPPRPPTMSESIDEKADSDAVEMLDDLLGDLQKEKREKAQDAREKSNNATLTSINDLSSMMEVLDNKFWEPVNRLLVDLRAYVSDPDISPADKKKYIARYSGLIEKMIHELTPADMFVAEKSNQERNVTFMQKWNEFQSKIAKIDQMILSPQEKLEIKKKFIEENWPALESLKRELTKGVAKKTVDGVANAREMMAEALAKNSGDSVPTDYQFKEAHRVNNVLNALSGQFEARQRLQGPDEVKKYRKVNEQQQDALLLLQTAMVNIETHIRRYQQKNIETRELMRLQSRVNALLSFINDPYLSDDYKERAMAGLKLPSFIDYADREIKSLSRANDDTAWFSSLKIELRAAITGIQTYFDDRRKSLQADKQTESAESMLREMEVNALLAEVHEVEVTATEQKNAQPEDDLDKLIADLNNPSQPNEDDSPNASETLDKEINSMDDLLRELEHDKEQSANSKEALNDIDDAVKKAIAEKRAKAKAAKEGLKPAVNDINLNAKLIAKLTELSRTISVLKGEHWHALSRNLHDIQDYLSNPKASNTDKQRYLRTHAEMIANIVNELVTIQYKTDTSHESTNQQSDHEMRAQWSKFQGAVADIDQFIHNDQPLEKKQKYLADNWDLLEHYKDQLVSTQKDENVIVQREGQAFANFMQAALLGNNGGARDQAQVANYQRQRAINVPKLLSELNGELVKLSLADQKVENPTNLSIIVALKECAALLDIHALRYKQQGYDVVALNALRDKMNYLVKVMEDNSLSNAFKQRALQQFAIISQLNDVARELKAIDDPRFNQGMWFKQLDISTAITNLQKDFVAKNQGAPDIVMTEAEHKAFAEIEAIVNRVGVAQSKKAVSYPDKLQADLKTMQLFVAQYEQRHHDVSNLRQLIEVLAGVKDALANRNLSVADRTKVESLLKAVDTELKAIKPAPFNSGLWFDSIKIDIRAGYPQALKQSLPANSPQDELIAVRKQLLAEKDENNGIATLADVSERYQPTLKLIKEMLKILKDYQTKNNDAYREGIISQLIQKLDKVIVTANESNDQFKVALFDLNAHLEPLLKDKKLNTHLHFDFFKQRYGNKKQTTLAQYVSQLSELVKPISESLRSEKTSTTVAPRGSIK